jgi:hypothetical protein
VLSNDEMGASGFVEVESAMSNIFFLMCMGIACSTGCLSDEEIQLEREYGWLCLISVVDVAGKDKGLNLVLFCWFNKYRLFVKDGGRLEEDTDEVSFLFLFFFCCIHVGI